MEGGLGIRNYCIGTISGEENDRGRKTYVIRDGYIRNYDVRQLTLDSYLYICEVMHMDIYIEHYMEMCKRWYYVIDLIYFDLNFVGLGRKIISNSNIT